MLSSVVKALRVFATMNILKVPVMRELRRLKDKLRGCYLNGFFLDRNTFLKADDADWIIATRKDDDGRTVDEPMVVLKNVVEMTVDHRGKVVAVESREKLGVWIDAFEHAIERFNE